MYALLLFRIAIALTVAASAGAGTIGINYGRVADNLPPAVKVVQLIKSQGINHVKLYDTDPAVIRAFSGTGIKITVALPNEQLSNVARHLSNAYGWVNQNVASYVPATQITTIAVGNEVFASSKNITSYLVPAMNNVHKALLKYNFSYIKVSSPVALSSLAFSYPPSSGAFKNDLVDTVLKPMLDFLRSTGSQLMVNVYPFFAYKDNAKVISLDYALFHTNAGVPDSNTGLVYKNLFDAQLDAVFSAMSALGYKDVDIVVTETGWPSKGDESETGASLDNAAAYNGNLVKHVLSNSGTPLRPKATLDTYLFALFNENKKPGPTSERNFGIFYPSEDKVYDISLSATALKNDTSSSGNSNRSSSSSPGAPSSQPFFAAGSVPIAVDSQPSPAGSTTQAPSPNRAESRVPVMHLWWLYYLYLLI